MRLCPHSSISNYHNTSCSLSSRLFNTPICPLFRAASLHARSNKLASNETPSSASFFFDSFRRVQLPLLDLRTWDVCTVEINNGNWKLVIKTELSLPRSTFLHAWNLLSPRIKQMNTRSRDSTVFVLFCKSFSFVLKCFIDLQAPNN